MLDFDKLHPDSKEPQTAKFKGISVGLPTRSPHKAWISKFGNKNPPTYLQFWRSIIWVYSVGVYRMRVYKARTTD